MYSLNGNYTLENGDILINPDWEFVSGNDNVKDMKVGVSVRFYSEGYVTSERVILIHDYNETGTWEDVDIINAILELPQFCNSTLI